MPIIRQVVILLVLVVCASVSASPTASSATSVDPLKLEWHRLATRRFLFSNNLPLCALVPSEVVAIESMHPLLAPGTGGPSPVDAKPAIVAGRVSLNTPYVSMKALFDCRIG